MQHSFNRLPRRRRRTNNDGIKHCIAENGTRTGNERALYIEISFSSRFFRTFVAVQYLWITSLRCSRLIRDAEIWVNFLNKRQINESSNLGAPCGHFHSHPRQINLIRSIYCTIRGHLPRNLFARCLQLKCSQCCVVKHTIKPLIS